VATLLDFLACAVSTARSYGAKLFFLTLDYWLKDSVYAAFLERIRDFPFAKFAILHLVPNVEEEIRRLQVIAKCLERIIVLSPDLKYDLEARFDLSNVEYLPHPAFIESYPSPPRTEIRTRLGIPEGRIAFSLLGELRDGKGVELLLEALPLLARQVRQRVFLLFGGKSTAEIADLVSRALQANAVLGRVRLRQVVNGYAALTDPEFADLIRASDVGLLLYQRDQRMRMSGILPNYAVAGVPVITTANSYCGRLVAAESLGQLLVTETPQEVASSIEEALELVGTRSFLPGLQAFAAQVSKRSVCECLSRLISERPIIRSADANATAESQS
jgi:glycosyltransferase involved in cell wall biosynthesis